jgi:hypothetical protein
MKNPISRYSLIVTLLITACARDNYPGSSYSHYERYEPTLVEMARMRHAQDGVDRPIDAAREGYGVADIDVVNYTDHVKTILRTKFTNARFARYTSATGQVFLAAASGAAAAFSAGATVVTSLALGSAAIPQLGDIFNAKARAGVYQDAVSKIEDAESAYYTHYSNPPTDKYTADGNVLYTNVTANIHVVEKAVLGELPDLKAVEQANTKSLPAGATPTPTAAPGTVQTTSTR